jgi:hypothetical protein
MSSKLPDLPSAAPAAADLLYGVDVSDTTESPAGSSRRFTVADVLALALSSVPAANTLYVAKDGSDATGARGNVAKPFLTLAAAKAAALAGDTIIVRPGTYNERNLLKTGVNWHFEAGAVVDYTGAADGGIFDDTPLGANGAVASKVTGHGRFRSASTSATAATYDNTPHTALRIHNPASDVYVEALSVECTHAQPSHAIFHLDGTLKCRIGTLLATGTTTVALRWDSGPLDYEGLQVRSDFYACYTDNPTAAAPPDDMRIRVSYVVGDLRMLATDPETKVWLDCLEFVGSLLIESGKFYFTCQKLSDPTGTSVRVNGPAQAWLSIQKVTVPALNFTGAVGIAFSPGASGFVSADIQHVENTGTIQGKNALGVMDVNGNADVRVGTMVVASGTPLGVRIASDGRLSGRIDASAATTGNPIKIIGPASVGDTNLVAAPGRDAVTADSALTLTLLGRLSYNTSISANVTLSGGLPIANGLPLVPTAAPGTNTTQAASTAFVTAAAALLAPIASPTFTGTATFGAGGGQHQNNTFESWRNAENNAWRILLGLDSANTVWQGSPNHLVQQHTGSRVEFLVGGATVMMSVRSQGGAGVLELAQVTAGGTPSTNTFRLYGLDVAGTCEGYAADEAGNQTQLTGHAFDGPASLYDAADWPHVVKEMNVYLGIVRYLNVSRTCRALELLLKAIRAGQTLADIRANLQARPLSDFDLFHQESFAEHNARPGASGTLVLRTWAADQDEKQARYDADRADAIVRHAGWAARAATYAAWLALPPEQRAAVEEPPEPGPEPVVPPAADVRKPIPAWLADRGA